MDKLEQLTERLYQEGLSKGRSEGERIVAEAEARASKIVAEAEHRAQEMAKRSHAETEELHRNTMTEISLAGREAVRRIKDEIANLIVVRSVGKGIGEAGMDPGFIKEMLVAAAKNWQGASSDKVTLRALLPAAKQKELDAAFEKSATELLAAGIEVGYSNDVRTGFKVGEKNGGYYIGFSDENFESLMKQYLREKAVKILYDKA